MRNLSTAHLDALRSWRSGLAALLLSGVTAGLGANAQAQTLYPPTGTVWDCVLSGGGQKGIAFITFSDDQSFSGYQILAFSPPGTPSVDGRNLGGGVGRNVELNGNTGGTNLFGFDQFEGPWTYDANGRVIGNFGQVSGGQNDPSAGVTNTVSFVAKVVPGKRLTLVASTSNGKVTYKGVPYTGTMPSLNGSWYGTKQTKEQSYLEFYTFASVADSNPFQDSHPDLSNYPGIYYTSDGLGGSYDVVGFSMLSSQKKIAFTFQSYTGDATNGVLNASFGSFSVSSKGALKATTAGIEAPDKRIHYTFNQPLTPPAGQ
jgi:hypothetical protein